MELCCTIKTIFIVLIMALNLLELPNTQGEEDDDEGEFNPCPFSDDEEEEHRFDCG